MKHGKVNARLGFIPVVFFFAFSANASLVAQGMGAAPQPAPSIVELRQRLEKILVDTHTPGLSVAIVRSEGPEWVAGLGKSDVAKNQAATDVTLFRIGSASKAFVSLAILQLANQGRLSLQDPVRKLAPEIWFENRWETTDPVRVVDLLEHTTGWDDSHIREGKDAKGMTLGEGLEYGRSSRISRWRPGTRESYCDSGPAVAAYIIEKITGEHFEDYVTRNLFLPMGMKTATYAERPSPLLATLYRPDGKTPLPYWHLMMWPSGGINASAKDMAAYLQFYLNRGAADGRQLLPASSIDRMETPTRAWEAKEGLKAGYGLSNYSNVQYGFVYHGHNGGMDGSLTEVAYLPEYNVGFYYSINARNDAAFWQIGEALREYVTRGLTPPAVPAVGKLPADAAEYAGWYEPAAPRNEASYFLDRLLNIGRLRFEGGKMLLSDLGEQDQTYIPMSGDQFRLVPKWGSAEPIATAALIAPNSEGRFVKIGTTLKRIPSWLAFTEIALMAWFLLAFVATLVYAPFWMLGGLIQRRRRPAERFIRLWPLVAVMSLLALVVLATLPSNNAVEQLGNLTVRSLSIFLSTVFYAVACLASAVSVWRARKREIRRAILWFSVAVTAGLLIAAVYMAYWGVIGVRTWS
jgi:CubicO group peptidase (beta-lactamase class C family)